MSKDCMFSKGKGYIVEWVDSINFAGWHSLSETEKIARKKENTNITYGEYVGDSEDGLYISLAQSFDSKKNAYLNINKVLKEGIQSVSQIEKGASLTVQKTTLLAILAFIVAVGAMYLTFNPPELAKRKVIESIDSDYNIIIE